MTVAVRRGCRLPIGEHQECIRTYHGPRHLRCLSPMHYPACGRDLWQDGFLNLAAQPAAELVFLELEIVAGEKP